MSSDLRTSSGYKLPQQVSTPIASPSHATMLLYGEKKIGKTSFASRFPESLFLMFEPGGGGLRITQEPMGSWEKFIAFIDLLEQTDAFETVIVDTIDMAYERCFEHVCKEEGMDHPADRAYGAGWKPIEQEFKRQMTRLMQTGRGVIFISHVGEKEMETIQGSKYQKLVPTMAGQAMKFIVAVTDIIAYYGYYGDDRYLTIRGNDAIESGHRLRYHFLTPKGAEALEKLEKEKDTTKQEDLFDQIVRIHSIPMGDDELEGYANFIRAFNNQQQDPMKLEDTPAGLRERAVKMKKR